MRNTFQKTIIFIGILIVINIALVATAYFAFQKTESKTLLIEDEIFNLNKRHLEIQNLRENLSQIKEIETDIAQYEKHIFVRKDSLSDLKLIEDLEIIAQNNQVAQRIVASNIDNTKSEKIEISLSVEGDYTNIFNYLNDLENYIYFINIEKMELTPMISSLPLTANPSVNLRLKISLYAQQHQTK